MQGIVYILVAILMFGVLIAVHELGHFISAKALGVKVNEFAIGMGPKLLRRHGAETEYTLRLFPIGGFCAMEGEDEDSSDPRAFGAVARWRQFCILVAGSATNFLTGLLILMCLLIPARELAFPVVDSVLSDMPAMGVLQPGDRLLKVDGQRVLVADDASLLFARSRDGAVTLEIERAGSRVTIDTQLAPRAGGGWEIGIQLLSAEATLGQKLGQSVLTSLHYVRTVWFGLTDLLTGRAGLKDLSGPIGIVGAVGGIQAQSVYQGVFLVLRFMALIAVNLAVMNLLPIPALDGGRILFLLVGGVFHKMTKRKINPKFEGYINAVGLICLLALMAIVAVSDVIKFL